MTSNAPLITIIGIAGGTASGKTTIAKKVYQASINYGTVALIKVDDYYRDLAHLTLSERQKLNFDHPEAYDSALLVKHLKSLKAGFAIEKPTYDFVKSTRCIETETIKPSDVIIVEGIMALAIPKIRALLDIKLYVETPDDIRFIRRLERDLKDRGRSVDLVINQYLKTVRPMHITFVEPSKQFADLIIPEGGFNEVAIDFITTKIRQLIQKPH